MAAIASERDGPWVLGTTWVDGVVPAEGDTATISAGHTVSIYESNIIGNDSGNALTINGILHVPSTDQIPGTTALVLKGNITFGSGGEFKIGESSSARLPSTTVFQIQINYSASQAAREFSFTVPSDGKISWYGAIRTTDTTLTGNITAGTNPTMTVAGATGWRIGDILVLIDETDRTKTEELTINTGYTPGSTTVPLLGTLANNKTSGWLVFNLSSNIVVKNYNDSYKSYFAFSGSSGTKQHVMSHVMLNNLGDATQTAFQIGRNITNNNNNDFIVNCYKCYQPAFTDSIGGNSIEKLTSYLSGGYGIQMGNNSEINNLNTINPTGIHLYNLNMGYYKLGTLRMCGGATYGLYPESVHRVDIDTVYAVAVASGVSNRYAIYNIYSNIYVGTATLKNGVYAINNQTSGTISIKQLNCSGNTSGDVNVSGNGSGGIIIVEKCQLSSTTPVLYSSNGGRMFVGEYNGTPGDNRVFQANNLLSSENTVYRTIAPAMKINIVNTIPIIFSLSSFARTAYVTSGKTVTLACYSRKDTSSAGAVSKLRISKGTDGHGLSETTEYSILPASTNTWTSQSINLGTTTSAGFINLEIMVIKGDTTWNLYIDDLTITES